MDYDILEHSIVRYYRVFQIDESHKTPPEPQKQRFETLNPKP